MNVKDLLDAVQIIIQQGYQKPQILISPELYDRLQRAEQKARRLQIEIPIFSVSVEIAMFVSEMENL